MARLAVQNTTSWKFSSVYSWMPFHILRSCSRLVDTTEKPSASGGYFSANLLPLSPYSSRSALINTSGRSARLSSSSAIRSSMNGISTRKVHMSFSSLFTWMPGENGFVMKYFAFRVLSEFLGSK